MRLSKLVGRRFRFDCVTEFKAWRPTQWPVADRSTDALVPGIRSNQDSNSFVSRLAPILEKLARAQSRMLGTADEVPADQWRTRPKGGGWCAAEIVAHLIMVERSVVGSADRVVQHPPKRFSRLQRLHLPLALVEARLVKRAVATAGRSRNARREGNDAGGAAEYPRADAGIYRGDERTESWRFIGGGIPFWGA